MESVKIFYGSGWHGLKDMEAEINEWLDTHTSAEIVSLAPTMCTVGHSNEMYQGLSVVVHYRETA
jgi:hypothetical protein